MAARFGSGDTPYSATAGLPTSTAWTVTCWFRLASDQNNYTGIWGLDNGTGSSGIWWTTDSDGTSCTAIDGGLGSPAIGYFAASLNTWYCMGLTVSGTTVTTYTGTTPSALTTDSNTMTLFPASPSRLLIGNAGSASVTLDGRIAGWKAWTATLSAAEVANELAQYTPARASNLLRWHPFVTAETTDYSGAGNALTGGTGVTTEDGSPIPWAALAPINAVGG